MVKKLLSIGTVLLLILAATLDAYPQKSLNYQSLPEQSTPATLVESRNGFCVPASGVIRVLFVFAEYDYPNGGDPTPVNGTSGWQAHSLPDWANNLTDVYSPAGIAAGVMTRYYQMASSGNYTVLGDYLPAPDNGGVFNLTTDSTHPVGPDNAALIANVNSQLGNTIITAHGLNGIEYFDLWTCHDNVFGLPKTSPSTENPRKYDHVVFIWRNSSFNGIGNYGYSSPGTMLGHEANSYSWFGTYGSQPTQIMIHEFAHLIYGGTDFHAGGGGWFPGGDYWIPTVGGWSNLGLSGASLLTWNAWDRQRLDWKSPGNIYSVSARDATNSQEMNGDLDATNPAQAGIYTLRDFVSTGDAIRIKLPFTDPDTEYPEFLWIENHNTETRNQCPWDKFLWQEGNSCVQPAIFGLYAYLQIDRETRQAGTFDDVFKGYACYLRPVTAEGFWDKEFETTSLQNDCVSAENMFPFMRLPGNANPLTGCGDQEFYAMDWNHDDILDHNDQYYANIENVGGIYYKNLFNNGHSRNVFTRNGNHKIGIGTNPSSATLMNMVGYDTPVAGAKNLRKAYLNGVSVDILNQDPNGNMQVKIRFDDVDVTGDVRWCADEIVLNPLETPSGYSLNLKTGSTITLDQGTTATRMTNPVNFNGKKIFASPTVFTVNPQAKAHLEPNAHFVLKNSGSLNIKPSSSFIIEDGGSIEVQCGSTLRVEDCGFLAINDNGKLKVKSGATLCFSPQAILAFENGLQNLEMEPGVIIPPGFVNPETLMLPVINTLSVTENTNWINQSFLVTGIVTIGSGSLLSIHSSTIRFKDMESKIIVQPGARVIVDSTLFTSACHAQWQGIEVWGNSAFPQTTIDGLCVQGIVEMGNGSVLENAYNGITNWHPGDWASAGGIIKAENCTFRNNRRSVEFMKYRNFNPVSGNETENVSTFSNCVFEVNDEYPATAAPFYAQVSLWQVNGIRFSGCDFLNNRSEIQEGYGIHSIDAGYRVAAFSGSMVSPNPVSELDSSFFKGYLYAIYASNSETENTTTVSNTSFINNIHGIELHSVNHATILNNRFGMGQVNNGNDFGDGINLNSCSGYAIEENVFYGGNAATGGSFTGIEITNSGAASNEIYKNTFQNLTTGILTDLQNASTSLPASGLSFRCNTNSGNRYDIYVTGNPGSGISPFQGSVLLAAGNTFSENAVTNFHNGGTSVYYYHSPGQEPTVHYGLQLVETVNANTCPSHLGTGIPAGSNLSANKMKELQLMEAFPGNENLSSLYLSPSGSGNISQNQILIALGEITVSPNPASGWIAFNYKLPDGTKARLFISNQLGQIIEIVSLTGSKGTEKLDVSSYLPGMYFYKTDWLKGLSGKFIVE